MDNPATHSSSGSEDGLHEKIQRRMAEDEATVKAQFCEAMARRPGDFQKSTFRYLSEYFQIAAHWNLFLVWNYETVDSYYYPYLKAYAELVLDKANEMTSHWPARYTRQGFLRTLKNHITGLSQHWKAAALKRAREFEAGQMPADEGVRHAPEGTRPAGHSPDHNEGSKATQNSGHAPGVRRGVAPDMERHRSIAEMVARHATSWRQNPDSWKRMPVLKRICTDLDTALLSDETGLYDIPASWRSGRTAAFKGAGVRGWQDALDLAPKRTVTDRIAFSLKMVLKYEAEEPNGLQLGLDEAS